MYKRAGKKTKRICRYCKKEFLAWNSDIKNGFGFYCSQECRNEIRKTGKNLVCPICKNEFWVKKYQLPRRKTCSRKCASILCKKTGRLKRKDNPAYGQDYNRVPRIEVECEYCKKKFQIRKTVLKHNQGKFCSYKCSAKYRAERRDITGKNNPNYGNGQKIEGKNNPMWQGGKSFEPYPIEFNNRLKKQIRERDNHTCQECNYTEKQLGYKLHIHHIDYDKNNCNENNLISLCRSCHTKTNYKRNDWTEYYKQKLVTA